MKRLLDAVVAAALVVLLMPVGLVVGVTMRVAQGSPVLFRQVRSGRGGRPFTIFKFRTMRAAAASDGGPEHDAARLTRLGRFLRSTSLDELPTLFNVVRGDMSLVGPRPLPVAYLDRYDDVQARRLEVRPGITGLAQIRGRNALPWDDRLACDVWYVDHRSMHLDLSILARTVSLVVRGVGINHGAGVTMTEFRGRRA